MLGACRGPAAAEDPAGRWRGSAPSRPSSAFPRPAPGGGVVREASAPRILAPRGRGTRASPRTHELDPLHRSAGMPVLALG